MKRKSVRRQAPVKKADKNLEFSYKEADTLRHYMTQQGFILSREKTGLSQKQQRQLTMSIKRARHLAMLPFTQTL